MKLEPEACRIELEPEGGEGGGEGEGGRLRDEEGRKEEKWLLLLCRMRRTSASRRVQHSDCTTEENVRGNGRKR